ncbi:MAG: aminoglycoside phosphotransferase, partial [Verrucomicrobiae bacterium]|nr:aminoglycoside phosphotransferase [Verrucomicrobiae bacterium]
IVDLDTVKPGLVHYDFGDCARSSCNPAGEETTDLSQVYLDVDLFEALVRGYLREAAAFLTEADRHYLYDSVRLIAFELGLRFFADHLAGDVYFKTTYDGHNLNRARVQFALCESIEARESKMRRALEGGVR